MGGKLRHGLCVVSGVVEIRIRSDLDELRAKRNIPSRSKLIGWILSSYLDSLRKQGGSDGRL
jgi:metal-responsive CopG/Arc/MetJ family transcriptional regulator